jgi:hypothetical protein
MGFFSRVFGRRKPETKRTTASKPFRIENPCIGFLNLAGQSGASLLEADKGALSPLFKESKTSSGPVPKCQVLFVYCSFDPQGNVVGSSNRLRDLIKEAGAYVAVVASGNAPDGYKKVLEPRNDWHANIVLVLDRRAERFASFFGKLFRAMSNGQSMLMAWVALAPQIPGDDHPENPSAFMLPEAGHVTFGG